jgi:hypothetical protein
MRILSSRSTVVFMANLMGPISLISLMKRAGLMDLAGLTRLTRLVSPAGLTNLAGLTHSNRFAAIK